MTYSTYWCNGKPFTTVYITQQSSTTNPPDDLDMAAFMRDLRRAVTYCSAKDTITLTRDEVKKILAFRDLYGPGTSSPIFRKLEKFIYPYD